MLQTWSRNSIWIHARHEPMTNPWYFSYDDNHISWIYLHPCMSSNPCRYLDGSRSMRLQLTHILSNLYITKSLLYGGWRQGSMKPFKYIFWQISISNYMILILDTQVLFLANLIHVGRWTPITSGAPNELHQHWASHTSSTRWSSTTSPPKVCCSILEKLYPRTWVQATQQDVNTSRCLKEKWQPHFELKRWVWPMIKCLHLTPKSIYSNIGDFVADQF